MEQLFRKDCIFISDKDTADGIFEKVSAALLDKGLVTNDFLVHVSEREQQYPTGIDLSVLERGLPNIAVPHTESLYVTARLLVPVKLTGPVSFGNMINPEQQIPVQYLFMILNNDPDAQANVLASVMDFVTKTDDAALQAFFAAADTEYIYSFLQDHFTI